MEADAVGSDVSTYLVIAELLDMGFEIDMMSQAIGVAVPCRADVLEFMLWSCQWANTAKRGFAKLPFCFVQRRFKQSSITDCLASTTGIKKEPCGEEPSALYPCLADSIDPRLPVSADICSKSKPESQLLLENSRGELDQSDKSILDFSCVKGFQKEALDALFARKDCLVLAATGSVNDGTMTVLAGKSLCFQIPARLSTKIVVVISPLISLMHDQCLKLAKHGISACFLGSGQPYSRVEGKAMAGMYKIIYVCPETVLRLMEPLKKLVEKPGIALFAIDKFIVLLNGVMIFDPTIGDCLCFEKISIPEN